MSNETVEQLEKDYYKTMSKNSKPLQKYCDDVMTKLIEHVIKDLPKESEMKFEKGDMVLNEEWELLKNGFVVAESEIFPLDEDGRLKRSLERKVYEKINICDSHLKTLYCINNVDLKESKPEPESPQFQIGDIVRLKSGGADMVVSRNGLMDPDGAKIVCDWHDKSHNLRRESFDPEVLDKIAAKK